VVSDFCLVWTIADEWDLQGLRLTETVIDKKSLVLKDILAKVSPMKFVVGEIHENAFRSRGDRL
jgi:hypothetical protein